ncbi:MAG: hypothetical protein IH628_07605, partial [Proteobacteria bacterium]|nr:hypothetical protein [Pseudomonadota bacterium]
METVSLEEVCLEEEIDLIALSRAFRWTVFGSPHSVQDMGPVKIVSLETVTVVLVDRETLASASDALFPRIDFRGTGQVIVLECGFNTDVAE